MVDGTRSKVVDDRLTQHDEVLEEVLNSQQAFRTTQTGIQGTLKLILERLTLLERVPNIAGGNQPQEDELLPIPARDMRLNKLQMVPIPPPKWELPSYKGYEPKENVKNRNLTMLIDSGSTYSFIDENIIKETGYQSSHYPPVRVTVADGNDWMKKYNPTKFDHENKCVTIGRKGKKLALHDIPDEGWMSMILSDLLGRMIKNGHAIISHLFMLSTSSVSNQEPVAEAVTRVSLDHAIPLKPGTIHVSLRSYRYKYYQKEELEKQKDGTWRFCVDYRGLNDITVKDKYPISIVDDLLDELYGSMVFTKVDLRTGYHQIIMRVEDVHKTTFRTHFGHYEFKHLTTVFDTLREHSLFAKRSKYSFAQYKVEYLGHIITNDGVSTDPTKIQALMDWPRPNSIKALRGFIGLTGYYRKYVANYGTICRPLADLLKRTPSSGILKLIWHFDPSIQP
ncbi:uncharacterized protein [Nicotiana tomentosiformis]|uniref:uncharacterized protein n=1 Tax=Nicotiana tomentosiformis TaxID=4098 RepID=UPI00388CA6C8